MLLDADKVYRRAPEQGARVRKNERDDLAQAQKSGNITKHNIASKLGEESTSSVEGLAEKCVACRSFHLPRFSLDQLTDMVTVKAPTKKPKKKKKKASLGMCALYAYMRIYECIRVY